MSVDGDLIEIIRKHIENTPSITSSLNDKINSLPLYKEFYAATQQRNALLVTTMPSREDNKIKISSTISGNIIKFVKAVERKGWTAQINPIRIFVHDYIQLFEVSAENNEYIDILDQCAVTIENQLQKFGLQAKLTRDKYEYLKKSDFGLLKAALETTPYLEIQLDNTAATISEEKIVVDRMFCVMETIERVVGKLLSFTNFEHHFCNKLQLNIFQFFQLMLAETNFFHDDTLEFDEYKQICENAFVSIVDKLKQNNVFILSAFAGEIIISLRDDNVFSNTDVQVSLLKILAKSCNHTTIVHKDFIDYLETLKGSVYYQKLMNLYKQLGYDEQSRTFSRELNFKFCALECVFNI